MGKVDGPVEPSVPPSKDEGPEIIKDTNGNVKGGGSKAKKDESEQVFEFPYKLASEWNVWYDRPQSKKPTKEAYNNLMKQIYQFDSVKAFWGLYNHLNLEKMPTGSNLRIFKSHIQPTWEDEENRGGGNWILVPRPREHVAIPVFKELLLSMIGGELDPIVNGVVLSIKAKDTIIQLWCPRNVPAKYNKVQKLAKQTLDTYIPKLVTKIEGRTNPLEWSWRAHPVTAAAPAANKKKSVSEGGEDPEETMGSAEPQSQVGLPEARGSCGECIGRWNACTVM